MKNSLLFAAVVAVVSAPSLDTTAQAGAGDVIASGLVLPIGLEADAGGQLWVSEMGVGPKGPAAPGVGRVSMLAANLDGSFTLVPLIENIPTAFNAMGEPSASTTSASPRMVPSSWRPVGRTFPGRSPISDRSFDSILPTRSSRQAPMRSTARR